MCLVIVEKELWTWLWSSNFQNATFEKKLPAAEVVLIQMSFLVVGFNQNK